MKIVIPGGSGQIGQILARRFRAQGHDVVVLSRAPSGEARCEPWDGKSLGPWQAEIDGADVVINLAGRSVNCRYTDENLRQMLNSRVDSTRAVGEAISAAKRPPKIWLQMSTATIYAHRFDAANDEFEGIIGGTEKNVPRYWDWSIRIARAWEEALNTADTPHTRRIALRSAMVMSPDRGGIFDVLAGMTRCGLGGAIGGGCQYVSWIHEEDFCTAVEFLIHQSHISGAVNLASPDPLPQKYFMAQLRSALGIPLGLPATAWMAEIGAFFLRTDTELILKSRRVFPARLLREGFTFSFPEWNSAAGDLVERWKNKR